MQSMIETTILEAPSSTSLQRGGSGESQGAAEGARRKMTYPSRREWNGRLTEKPKGWGDFRTDGVVPWIYGHVNA
jgi:hypothetical protein